jgi:hypothetical protein
MLARSIVRRVFARRNQIVYEGSLSRLTGFVDEKKSMSLPTVNGTLIETADETKSRPTAMSSGFFSGLARDIIFLNDDDPVSSLRKAWDSLFHRDSFNSVVGVASRGSGVVGAVEVEVA